METEEEQEVYSDYLQMIQHIDPRKLKFKKVTCGYKSTLLIDGKYFEGKNNELWGFGSSLNGQLGTYQMKYFVNRPFNISRLNDKMFLNACVSQTHTLAISTTEKLFSWGSTQYGCLGQTMKDMHQYSILKLRKNMFVSQSESFERKTVYGDIACGENFSLIVCNDKLFSFGKEEKGRLGCGQQNIKYTEKPFQVQLPLSVKQVKGVSCGRNHCLMWDQDGLIYSWGDGADGKLGHSSVKGGYNYMIVDPQQIKALEEHRIIQASCGYRHSCAITFKGEIFTWGRTVYYKHEQRKELPLDYLRPKQISSFFCYDDKAISAGAFFIKISSFAYHNAAIDQKGFLYTWGQNKENCLGHNNSNDYNYPILVEEFSSMRVVDVSCGHHFTVVVSTKAANELAYKNLKEFKLNLIKNAKQNISKIQEYFEKKLRKNSTLGRNKSQSQLSSVKHIHYQSQEADHHQNQKHNQAQKNQHTPDILNAPRSLSQPSLFNQKERQKQTTPVISNQVKEKYKQLQISDSLFKQNINAKIILIDQEQKQILNQRPLISNNRNQQNNQDLIQRMKSHSNYTSTHRNLLQKQEMKTKNRNLKKKTSFFEFKDNKIVFDTIQAQLDQEYEEFCQQENQEQKSPKNQVRNSIQENFSDQRKSTEVSTKRERLSEIQMRAEQRRTVSNQQNQGIVLSDTIFNQEIEQIYKEYKDADMLHIPKNAMKKYVRQKSNDFQKTRQQLSYETRKIFQQARSEFTSNQSSEVFKTPINSSQTLGIIQNQFPRSNFTSISNIGSPSQQQINKIEDFLAQDKWKMNLCQNGNTTRLQDPKHQEIYKEKLDKLSAQYCVKRSQSGDFTVAQSKYEDYQTFLQKKTSFRGSMMTLQSIPDFYGHELSNNQNIQDLINQQANKQQTKFGLILSNLNVGAKAHGEQLKEVLSRNISQVEQQEILQLSSQKIGFSPLKLGKNQSQNVSLNDLNEQNISQMAIQYDDNNNNHSNNHLEISPNKKKKIQIVENKQHHKNQHTNYKYDFSKSLLPYSIHANDIVTPNIYSIRLEIIKANEQAMKVASEAEKVIKKKIMLSVLRQIKAKHQQNILQFYQQIFYQQQFEKVQQKFMQDNINQINMERARLMLITPASILNSIWNKEQDNVRFRGVKRHDKNSKKDHLPFFDLKVKIASQIQNAPIKPSFKLQITQDQFKQFFNKYYDQVRKQFALLEQKGLIRAQVKKKN